MLYNKCSFFIYLNFWGGEKGKLLEIEGRKATGPNVKNLVY